MAENTTNIFNAGLIDLEGLKRFWGNAKTYINTYAATLDSAILDSAKADATTKADAALAAAKTYAEGQAATALQGAKDYADGLAGNYDAAGSAANALKDAKSYTDTAKSEAISSANGYTDTAKSEAISSANGYTDGKISEVTNAFGQADATLKSELLGVEGTDGNTIYGVKKYAGEQAAAAEAAAKSHAEAQAADALQSAKDYADEKAEGANEAAIQEAKTYADGLNTAMNTRVEALEAIDHDHDNKAVLDGISSEKVSLWDGAASSINDFLTGTGTAEVVDTLKDIQEWMNGEGVVATELTEAIAAEAKLRGDADTAINDKIGAVTEGKTVVGMIAEAQAAAIEAAAADATSKANAAESKAKAHAETKASEAQAAAEATAAADATSKANAAQAAAEATAAADATSKANAAETAAKAHAETKASAAESNAKSYTDGKVAEINKAIEDNELVHSEAYNDLNGRVGELEAIDHDAYVAADTALKTSLEAYADQAESDAKSYTDGLFASITILTVDQIDREIFGITA
jgi:hypothetical protein